MNGKILDFNAETGEGMLRADDGNRYGFSAAEFKSQGAPTAGMVVDFDIVDKSVVGIYAKGGGGGAGGALVDKAKNAFTDVGKQIMHGDPNATVAWSPDQIAAATGREKEGENPSARREKGKNIFSNFGQQIMQGDPNATVTWNPDPVAAPERMEEEEPSAAVAPAKPARKSRPQKAKKPASASVAAVAPAKPARKSRPQKAKEPASASAAAVAPAKPPPNREQPNSMFPCADCGKPISGRAATCPHCGAPVGACRTCGRPFDAPVGQPKVASPRSNGAASLKSSGVGIVLSFFWTGLGQLYAGEILRGIILMIATPMLGFGLFLTGWGGMSVSMRSGNFGLASVLVSIALLFIPLAWWIWGMVDARNLCEAYNRKALR